MENRNGWLITTSQKTEMQGSEKGSQWNVQYSLNYYYYYSISLQPFSFQLLCDEISQIYSRRNPFQCLLTLNKKQNHQLWPNFKKFSYRPKSLFYLKNIFNTKFSLISISCQINLFPSNNRLSLNAVWRT